MNRKTSADVVEKVWYFIPPKEELNRSLAADLDIDPIVARVLTNRGLEDPDAIHSFIYPKLTDLRDPFLMKDMDKAIDRTLEAVARNEKIVVYGDYDVDGITSIAMLMGIFRTLHADCSFYLPNRITQGYGVSMEGISKCLAEGAKLIISVDCGVSSTAEAAYAEEKGTSVIITDHHEPGERLPECTALLNPKRKDAGYPFKDLAGVGVAFKFAQGLIHCATERGMLSPNIIHIKDMLDVVALGTVADVVPLLDENRVFVKYGLRQINKTDRIGLRELKAVASVNHDVTSADIAFKLAPRLNAVGRLGDARHAVKLLTSEDEQEAFNLATIMEESNRRRQNIEGHILTEVEDLIDKYVDMEKTRTIVLHSANWHQGVIGIVASRIAKHYHKPTLIISFEGKVGKGSGRSVEGFDLLEGLRQCHDLLDSYGGHRLAAGFQINMDNIDRLCERLEQIATEQVDEADRQPKLTIDAEIHLEEVTLDFIANLEILEPFGSGNPRPMFCARNLFMKWAPKVVGNNHLKLWFEAKDRIVEGIAFSKGGMISEIRNKGTPYDIVFVPKLNYYRGQESVQLFIRDIKPSVRP